MKIFFDLDGTLINVKKKTYMVYMCLISNYEKVGILDIEEYWKLKTTPISERNIVSKELNEVDTEDYLQKRRVLLEEKEYCFYDTLFEGVEETLKNLSKVHTLYIVTLRKNRWRLLKQLEDFKIIDYFQHVFNGDDKAELIETYIDNQSVIIGDTEIEINTARKLNIIPIAVSCGLRNEKFLSKQQPFYILKSVADLKL